MNQEIARKQPAQVVRRGPIPRGTVRQVVDLAAPSRGQLSAALRRRQQAGEIERTSSDIRLIIEGPRAGYYAVRVVLVPPRARDPRWAVICRNVGIGLAGLAALGASLAWLLSSLTREAVIGFLLFVLVAFGIWLKVRYGRGGGGGGGSARGVIVDVHTSVRIG